ncbi:uncharacterized protein LOC119338725 [Triticum dicoccoides]|uniref:uncharacterized protein LOC119338725 n=1 Tax=Triticum dicoccoides TaxID=85692 RepID=UPI00189167DF|nr:uncharacterized protein LOC119338725 [Triticum dicoccoides]
MVASHRLVWPKFTYIYNTYDFFTPFILFRSADYLDDTVRLPGCTVAAAGGIHAQRSSPPAPLSTPWGVPPCEHRLRLRDLNSPLSQWIHGGAVRHAHACSTVVASRQLVLFLQISTVAWDCAARALHRQRPGLAPPVPCIASGLGSHRQAAPPRPLEPDPPLPCRATLLCSFRHPRATLAAGSTPPLLQLLSAPPSRHPRATTTGYQHGQLLPSTTPYPASPAWPRLLKRLYSTVLAQYSDSGPRWNCIAWPRAACSLLLLSMWSMHRLHHHGSLVVLSSASPLEKQGVPCCSLARGSTGFSLF